jgi:hypothetical protein
VKTLETMLPGDLQVEVATRDERTGGAAERRRSALSN